MEGYEVKYWVLEEHRKESWWVSKSMALHPVDQYDLWVDSLLTLTTSRGPCQDVSD